MKKIEITAYELAQRFVGQVFERAGVQDHPLIQWWLSLCGYGLDSHDEVPWCSAFCQGPTYELRLPRSKSAAARSWLTVGIPVPLDRAEVGFDVVILKRGGPGQPGPDVIAAPGHVGFFGGHEAAAGRLLVLGGNQGDAVTLGSFRTDDLLGVRRLFG